MNTTSAISTFATSTVTTNVPGVVSTNQASSGTGPCSRRLCEPEVAKKALVQAKATGLGQTQFRYFGGAILTASALWIWHSRPTWLGACKSVALVSN